MQSRKASKEIIVLYEQSRSSLERSLLCVALASAFEKCR
jgi:hypothetical protein